MQRRLTSREWVLNLLCFAFALPVLVYSMYLLLGLLFRSLG